MENIFELAHDVFNSWLMFAVWLIPFACAICMGRRKKLSIFYLLALFCIPFLMYFLWAISDIWSSHEAALAFNRMAQVVAAIVLMIFLWVFYEHR